MNTAKILFWSGLAILFYSYIGYGILIFFIYTIKGWFTGKTRQPGKQIPVTLIIPAYNEKDILPGKIKNCLSLNYPKELFTIIIVTDGSDDDSQGLIPRFSGMVSLHQPARQGKFAAIKRAMKRVTSPVVVFSDANAMLNPECISKLVLHYADPRVGGVAGEKKIFSNGHATAVGEAEGFYWKYESVMKQLDAKFHTVVGAAGELFSIRTELFPAGSDDIILDDFVVSMKICSQGYRIGYEPGAFAIEMPSLSLAEEEKRKVRIAAGAYQSIGLLKNCMNIFRYPLLSFQYFSRRLMRWVFCPLMLVILLVSNFILALNEKSIDMYDWFLFIQLLFYFLSGIGWWLVRLGKKIGLLTIPFYFLFMNYCLVRGFFRFLMGNQGPAWEKSLRMNKAGG